MRHISILVVALLSFSAIVNGAGCNSQTPSYGNPNLFPINDASTSMKLISTTKNGKLYVVEVPQADASSASNFTVLHVWGSAYDMGFAQGTLLKDKSVEFIDSVWAYMESEIDNVINFLPSWLQNYIADLGLDAALDLTYYLTKPYAPQHFYDEMRGLADGSGGDYNRIVRVHMIAGLTQGKCSMFGAWGAAVPTTQGVLQLRALDWDMNGPFRDYSQITVYHPTDGHAFASVAMVGFVGGLTGISSTKLGISEIGVDYPDSTFGSESRIGLPFIFILRDILQFDYTLDDAINRLANARRTCDLILGVGDGKMNEFRAFEYSYSVLNVMDDMNMMPYNQTWHPRMKNVVYYGMDWLCPSYNLVLSQMLQKYYGKITPENAIKYISAVEMSGDNHLAFYDLSNLILYVSFAAPHSVGGPVAAYDRQFTRFDANALFNEQPPSN